MFVVNGVEDLAIVQQRNETSFQLCFRAGIALMRKGGKDPDLWKTDYSMKYLGYTTGTFIV